MLYRIWYARWSPYVGQGSRTVVWLYGRGMRWEQPAERPYEIPVDPPLLFTVERLPTTHVMIRQLEAPARDIVFHRMQVDRWPEIEAVAFSEEIIGRGLTHSSLSAGDVVEDVAAGQFWECDLTGWRELERV